MGKILAIIPARGGSKGIPNKNVRLLAGKPLVAHTIEQARTTASIDRVVVSTDDTEIAAVSQQFGAEVVWRPEAISGDLASSEDALLHTLAYLQQSEGYAPDLLVFLQCTAPLTLAEDIEGTIQALYEDDADTALAVVPFHYFLWRHDEDGNASGINHGKSRRLLRQERAPQYLETGAIYVMRVAGFLEARGRFFGKTALYVMPHERRLEIDEPVDLQVAEVLLQARIQQNKSAQLPERVAAVVFDFDGVFTDNRVLVLDDGREAVLCHRGDGMGLDHLKQLQIPLLVLSTETNPVVQARCAKLQIPCRQGLADKLSALREWAVQEEIDLDQVVYLGNDVNDLACLQTVGCGVVVADAHPAVHSAASIILSARGGHGAIRELADLILQMVKTRTNIETDTRIEQISA